MERMLNQIAVVLDFCLNMAEHMGLVQNNRSELDNGTRFAIYVPLISILHFRMGQMGHGLAIFGNVLFFLVIFQTITKKFLLNNILMFCNANCIFICIDFVRYLVRQLHANIVDISKSSWLYILHQCH